MHEIRHFDQWEKALKTTLNWFPSTASDQPVTVALTSGASCPDTLVDEILIHIVSYFRDTKSIEEALKPYKDAH
jgi:4-hydroxy-3-methylbut-2-enyl diphosphate reductase